MKRFVFGTLIALMLVAAVATPVFAADTATRTASVTVNQVMSITLIDAGDAGIVFGSVDPGAVYGDVAQLEGTPAIKVNVGAETNVAVDIKIKGTAGTGTLAMDKWQYTKTFTETPKIGLTTSLVTVYDEAAASSSNAVYHWIDIATGTAPGSNSITVTYQAIVD